MRIGFVAIVASGALLLGSKSAGVTYQVNAANPDLGAATVTFTDLPDSESIGFAIVTGARAKAVWPGTCGAVTFRKDIASLNASSEKYDYQRKDYAGRPPYDSAGLPTFPPIQEQITGFVTRAELGELLSKDGALDVDACGRMFKADDISPLAPLASAPAAPATATAPATLAAVPATPAPPRLWFLYLLNLKKGSAQETEAVFTSLASPRRGAPLNEFERRAALEAQRPLFDADLAQAKKTKVPVVSLYAQVGEYDFTAKAFPVMFPYPVATADAAPDGWQVALIVEQFRKPALLKMPADQAQALVKSLGRDRGIRADVSLTSIASLDARQSSDYATDLELADINNIPQLSGLSPLGGRPGRIIRAQAKEGQALAPNGSSIGKLQFARMK
jgi:hypothetical protein